MAAKKKGAVKFIRRICSLVLTMKGAQMFACHCIRKKKLDSTFLLQMCFAVAVFFFSIYILFCLCHAVYCCQVSNQQTDNIYGKTDFIFYRFITQILQPEP